MCCLHRAESIVKKQNVSSESTSKNMGFINTVRSYLKFGFWSKVKAAVNFNPEEYSSISRT